MFREAMKDIHSYFEYGSEMPSKLSSLYWLYSSLMNIDKILEDFEKSTISDFKEIQEELLEEIKQEIKEEIKEEMTGKKLEKMLEKAKQEMLKEMSGEEIVEEMVEEMMEEFKMV